MLVAVAINALLIYCMYFPSLKGVKWLEYVDLAFIVVFIVEAGVKIHEYVGGLLHTKSLTMDGEVSLIGSAKMDRRSFELNYENNILLADPKLTADFRKRQQEYLTSSNKVTIDEVANWPLRRRLWNNTIAMLGPVL